MLIVSGTVLVLLTWTMCVLAVLSVGLLPALATAPRQGQPQAGNAAPVLRRALWWGLLLVTVFAYLVNLAEPLHSTSTAIAGCALVIVLGVPGWWLLGHRGLRLRRVGRGWPLALLWITLAVSLVYLSAAALGPVTNYDSGLYHLGAISYASEFPTVPGLANLYFAFGYGNAEFPLAALLGNGPWQVEGFRLLNGLVMTLAVVDLILRSQARRLGPGFFVLAAGVLAAWVPMVALSDYWVTSPTQDSSVFIVTIAATAYLADVADGGKGWVADAATALVLGIVLVLLRPTMIAFAASVLVVTVFVVLRRRKSGRAVGLRASALLVGSVAVLGGIAALARDLVLSGWLQYPLSVHAFDVPWLAADPAQYRLATLGYHRNPNDLWNSIDGWAWVGPWLSSRVTQWETYEFAGLLIAALAMATVATRVTRPNSRWRAMCVAMAPSAISVLVWWLATPPSYRFTWGPLFTLATVPLGWSLWLLTSNERSNRAHEGIWFRVTCAAVALPVLLVTAYSVVARFDAAAITAHRDWRLGIAIPYAVAPIADVKVAQMTTTAGLVLLQPVASEQCWTVFPLCTPQPDSGLRLRGQGIGSGFVRTGS